MAQIRGTIELLTKILQENGESTVKAETFRLAKFNDKEAGKPMLILLFELLYFCEYGKIDHIAAKACTELTQDELFVYVKMELQKRGFFLREFASLPRDLSTGSREMLLAFGWLMCKENVIQKFMQTCTSPLDDDTTALYLYQDDDVRTKVSNLESVSARDMSERMQQLLWFNNKLQLSLRRLYSLQRQKNILKHKIHEATSGVSLSPEKNHLSMLEVHMLRHPELLKKNLQLLEQDNMRLQNLLLWSEHEDIFWKWMGSVLQEQRKAALVSVMSSSAADSQLQELDVPAESVARLQSSHEKLQDIIVKYETIVDHLEKLWQEKGQGVSEGELDELLHTLELELSVQRVNMVSGSRPTQQSRQCVEPRFIYEPKKPAARTSLPPGVGSPSQPNSAPHLQEEIDSLQELVEDLEKDLQQKQDRFKQQMQTLANRFTDVVCIPPMAMKKLT